MPPAAQIARLSGTTEKSETRPRATVAKVPRQLFCPDQKRSADCDDSLSRQSTAEQSPQPPKPPPAIPATRQSPRAGGLPQPPPPERLHQAQPVPIRKRQ